MSDRAPRSSATALRVLALACSALTLAACPANAAPAARHYSGTPIDVLTYHYDNARTGGNRHEVDLTVASVSSSRFAMLKSIAVAGDVLAQPLLVAQFRMPDDSIHDVLVVATESNDVYAIDAATYETLWHVNLGNPQNASDLKCSKLQARPYGVSATPVIARRGAGRATVYLVASTRSDAGEDATVLHALDLVDGSDLHPPAKIAAQAMLEDGSTVRFSSSHQFVRAGLAYHDGGLYLGVTVHCEPQVRASLTGWLMRYDETLAQTAAFSMMMKPAGLLLASVWGAGFAPAIDHDGSVFAVTGNGNFSKGGKDWGESVLRLDASLAGVADWFTPAAYGQLNDDDEDFGAGGVLLVPEAPAQSAPPLAVAMGKSHVLYLLDRARLGHERAGDTGALQAQALTGEGVWGGPCYWLGPSGGLVYYQAKDDVLRAYALDAGANPSLTEAARGTITATNSLPTVSSNASAAGTGVVWAVNNRVLRAYDAQALGAPILETAVPPWRYGSAYMTPMVANGRVYVGTSNAVAVYGLSD